MGNALLQKLVDKSMTREELYEEVKRNTDLLSMVIDGVSSSKAAIRYGCAKVLMDFSEERPEKLYPHMEFFIKLLDSKYRILTWNAMAIIANLTKVDTENVFDSIFDKYYSFIDDEYMVTVANVVGNTGKIALAKPHLVQKITKELLRVEIIHITPHLSEECKRVIAEKAIKSFDTFFHLVENKKGVLSFVKRQLKNTRKTLRTEAENFLKNWN